MSPPFAIAGFFAALLASLTALAQPSERSFVPEQVFAGHSQGTGELRILLGKSRPFTVDSVGTTRGDGQLVLEQTMRFEGRPVETRAWVMRQTRPGHYSATLTGAAGPAVGRVDGNRLTLRYPLKRWGLVMHQTLDLSPDGRTLANRGTIRFLGIPVGRLRETITIAQPSISPGNIGSSAAPKN